MFIFDASFWGSVGIVAAAVFLVLVVVVSWLTTLIGLPGNWIVAAATAVYAYLIPAGRADIGWQWVITLFVLAAIGEGLEFLAGAAGTQQAGGSPRAAWLALVGSMVGGLAGAFVGFPIPIVGPLVGVVVMGGLGAAVGAFLAELSQGTDSEKTWKVSWGAFWGRLLGTGAKTFIGCIMVALVVFALVT